MPYIHLSALLALILFVTIFLRTTQNKHIPILSGRLSIILLFSGALTLRLLAAGLSKGFGTDTACFASWADRIYQLGPSGFYSPDVFTDYPPGYMYLLYPIGALRSLLGIDYYSIPHLILLKLPSILCDLACGFLLYREALRKCTRSTAFLLCTAYLFNPAVILNSSVWGQVDAVFTLALFCMCLSLVHGRLVPSYVAFFAALLIKPQALFLAPVLFVAVLDQLILHDFSLVRFLRSLAYGIMTFCGAALLCAPFGLNNVWNQYFSTVSSYPYAAVNAYNFWGLAGLNWISQDNTFMGLPYYVYGYAVILAAVVILLAVGFKHHRDREKYPLLGAFLLVTIFLFSVRMHERYLYPAMLLLLAAYVYKPSRRLFFCYGGLSLLHFYNTAHVLFFYDPTNYDRRTPMILFTSLGMLAMGCFLYQTFFRLYGVREAETASWAEMSQEREIPTLLSRRSSSAPKPSRRGLPFQWADLVLVLLITAVYSCFALHDLGDRQAPATTHEMTTGESLVFDFGENIPVTLSYYIAPWHNRVFVLEGKRASVDEWVPLGEITLKNVFTWQELTIEARVPYLRLTLQDTQASLLELCFLDGEGNVITPVNAGDYPALFDEQYLHPARSSFRNSMYFDEIYHARTAYEFLHGLYSYENTHPPLGKLLIAAGVSVFGMNPFGWRIAGVLFGILMVPFVYLFARRLTESIPMAALASVLFTFDFMHLAQTRLATIDVYITFFVILMYYFMYQYSTLSFYDMSLKRTFLPLGACGICMGLGVACKWTGAYAGTGLAVIFFATLWRRYREYSYAKEAPEGESNGISHREVLERFAPCTGNTILFCLVFFVVIPALIYVLSYLPFRDYSQDGVLLRMLHNQTTMFNYHSSLNATHPYSSTWYQWPTMVRPIWYYSGLPGETLREGISAFGNPLVWWLGIPAFVYMICLWARENDRKAAFLVVGYLAQYLPWVFVTRVTFIYHYFPSVVFVVLMIIHSITRIKKHMPRRRFYLYIGLYGVFVVALFLLFYPVLTGQPVEADYVSRWLRWFDSWVLTAR